jgi:RHS repeat-associated protein
MRAWDVLRQVLSAVLCVLLAVPAYSSEKIESHHLGNGGVYPKSRVWGSNEKTLLHFRATLLPSEKQHRGYEKCRWKNVVGSVVTYDYDAFGNVVHSTGNTPNNYLFGGEQFDQDLGLYYNRARYLNTSTGRFWSMDVYEGYGEDPLSLHKYLYAEADPVDSIDPTGRSLSNLVYGQIVHDEIGIDFVKGDPKDRFSDTAISIILGVPVPLGSLRPDLTDRATQQVYEIKPTASAALGYPQLAGYLIVLNKYDPLKRVWIPGVTYLPPPVIQLGGGVIALVSPPAGGVIVYEVLNPVEILGLAAIAIKSMVPQLETDFAAATLEEVY